MCGARSAMPMPKIKGFNLLEVISRLYFFLAKPYVRVRTTTYSLLVLRAFIPSHTRVYAYVLIVPLSCVQEHALPVTSYVRQRLTSVFGFVGTHNLRCSPNPFGFRYTSHLLHGQLNAYVG